MPARAASVRQSSRDQYSAAGNAADHVNQLSPVVKNFPSDIYAPNTGSKRADVINPKRFKIARHFKAGRQRPFGSFRSQVLVQTLMSAAGSYDG